MTNDAAPSTEPLGDRPSNRDRYGAGTLVPVVGVALLGLLLLREGAPAPVLTSSALLTGAVLVSAVGLRLDGGRSLVAAGAALVLLVFLLWTHGPAPQTLGDDWYWGYWNEGQLGRPRTAWTSSLLPSVVVGQWGPSVLSGLNIPLALGTVAALAAMARSTVAFARPPGRALCLGVVVFVLFSLPMVFGEDYHEMYPLAVFAATVASAWIVRWWRDGPAGDRDVVAGGVLCAVAALGHPVMIGVTVLGFAVIRSTARIDRRRTSLIFGAALAAAAVVTLGLVRLAGFELVEGNTLGATGGALAPDLASLDHGRGVVLNGLWVLTAPAVVVAYVAVRRGSLRPVLPLLAPTVVPLGLLAVWGFDYGFPTDVDLMITATVVAVPGVLGTIGLERGLAHDSSDVAVLVAIAVAVLQSGFLITTGVIPT